MLDNLTGSGIHYNTGESARPELLEPSRPGEHVWVATVAFRITPDEARASEDDASQVHLDMENIAAVGVICFVCEEPFTQRLSYRRCKGEPND